MNTGKLLQDQMCRLFTFWYFRYDCRGALSDLKSVEALPFGQSRWEGLTADEKKIEQLCDEERYKSLNDRSEEESIYQGN